MKTLSKIAATLMLVTAFAPAAFAQTTQSTTIKPSGTIITKSTHVRASGTTMTRISKIHPSGRKTTKTIKVTANGTRTVKTKGGRKGGYVHSTTVVTPSGRVIHRKGYYRHSTTTTTVTNPS